MNNFGNSVWNLDDISYRGRLCHYTGESSYKKILKPAITNFPSNCVSMQLTRIDSFDKDKKERQHIRSSVESALQKLVAEQRISNDLAKTIFNQPQDNIGYCSIIEDKKSSELKNSIAYLYYGEIDYYVACFCQNLDSAYMREHFGDKQIFFNSGFSYGEEYIYRRSYPFKILHDCLLDYHIKKVLYKDSEKNAVIEDVLLDIADRYNHLDIKDDIKFDIQMMYSFFDAFFKDIDQENEEEVRLVILLPRQILPQIVEANINFDVRRNHLYLPISKDFLIINYGDTHA